MFEMTWKRPLYFGLFIWLSSAAPFAFAQTVEEFYRGRNVTIYIPSAPGGVNDIAGRMVARFLPKYIPGSPKITPRNDEGAAGIAMANRIYNSSDKDGSVIAIIERATPQLAIQGDPNVKFDPEKFTWLGSLSSYVDDAYILVVNDNSPVRSVEDLKAGQMTMQVAAMNPSTTNTIFAAIAKNTLGLNISIIRGYTGAAPMFLAMQRGEADAQVVGLSSIKAGQPALWSGNQVRALIQFGRMTRNAELPNVPTGRELAPNAEALALLDFAELPFFMALPFFAPPGLPADRAHALQKAFMAMCADVEFQAEAKRYNLDLSPIDGEAVRRLLAQAAKTPKSVIESYNDIVGVAKR